METSIFIDFIGDSPLTRVIDYLLSVKEIDFSITDLADNAHIGRATLYRIWDRLIKHKIILPTRIIGNAKLYKLNACDPKIIKLIELDNMLVMEDLKKRSKQKIVLAA